MNSTMVFETVVVTYFYQENAIGLMETIIIITNCTRDCFTVLVCFTVPKYIHSSFDCDLARIRLHSVTTLVLLWHDLGILSIPRDRQQIHLNYSHQLPSDIWLPGDLIG